MNTDNWFQNIGYFYDGVAVVRMPNGKWNYINKDGKFLSDVWFDEFSRFLGGFARVKVDGKYNYIDKDGNLLSDVWFDWGSDFTDGFAMVKINRLWRVVDTKGGLHVHR